MMQKDQAIDPTYVTKEELGYHLSMIREALQILSDKSDDRSQSLEKIARRLEKLSKSSTPIAPSSDRNPSRPRRDQTENETPLSPSSEMRQLRDSYSHGKAYLRKPETSHCTASGSSRDILSHARISFHQTSTLRESDVQLLSQTLSSILAQHGSSTLTDELFQVLSSLLLTPALECHVEQRGGHICIQFLSEIHPKSVHSELNLRQNSRNN